MKTIKDAVIALNGKLPDENEKGCFRALCAAIYCVEGDNGIRLGSFEEFEAEAKRMGYISGYRWGVEYATNGKRPDLADDVELSWSCNVSGASGASKVSRLDWSVWIDEDEGVHTITSFKITDPRHKPADTSYLNQSTFIGCTVDNSNKNGVQFRSQTLTHSEEGLTHKAVDEASEISESNANELAKSGGGGLFSGPVSIINVGKIETGDNGGKGPLGHNPNKDRWHERGELPPAGVECELKSGSLDDWFSGVCVAHHSNGLLAIFEMSEEYPFKSPFVGFEARRIRPIRTEREKVIEAAMAVGTLSGPGAEGVYGGLYDAGMLVLPPKKSDTED